jgi:hypothetical protein
MFASLFTRFSQILAINIFSSSCPILIIQFFPCCPYASADVFVWSVYHSLKRHFISFSNICFLPFWPLPFPPSYTSRWCHWHLDHYSSKQFVESSATLQPPFSQALSSSFCLLGMHVLAATMKISVFWNITLCTLMKVNRRFAGKYHLYLQGRRVSSIRSPLR